ncbi:three-helix bundle dimerization domain-containing protein [Agromyces salentinus]|nr:hypothetical protein [Agromyces salentinus]
MSEPDTRRALEADAIEHVVTELTARYPSVDATRVRGIVEDEARRLVGNPVRDYVPSLVAHAADERLRQEGEPIHAGAGDPGGPVLASEDDLDPLEVERREREQHAGFLFGDLGGGSV